MIHEAVVHIISSVCDYTQQNTTKAHILKCSEEINLVQGLQIASS